ncbi:MAG TPA: FGGY-family carbohydrate kinase [Dinghuibacter sp.]|uniref:FGGY-family carbohydrate kinase n=1 Tax=Dinghuibacter sp. TaxID=2024697 RepID=UPI002C47EC7E|nr:FGGY-family carbohydrate kinase [Dinghuibacter sp.]HTJ12377.1 FGGY-family carbohydrate kinase [Dinghuibacter sp.]
MTPCFIGIDIGTQGARVVLVNDAGELLASASEAFPLTVRSREEQSPYHWWEATLRALRSVHRPDVSPFVKAISVSSTSGTVIPVDAMHRPLHHALMYSDRRAAAHPLFHTFGGLARMTWWVDRYPDKAIHVHRWLHAADYITGELSDTWGVTDYTNAYKSGYDLNDLRWREPLPGLPAVLPTGSVIGTLRPELAAGLGLPDGVAITNGITDGCASQIASGAIRPGQWNTTIGTTMVIKGVTTKEISNGVLYSHRHPDGYWMPGGASNTGADWVTGEFGYALDAFNQSAMELMPTGLAAWPLRVEGERFPFLAPEARGFEAPTDDRAVRYTANMEGVAYLERYAYEMIGRLCGEPVKAVFTAGGASNSEAWLTIRCNVLNKPIHKTKEASAAMGAAILAATPHHGSLTEAVTRMVTVDKTLMPRRHLVAAYEHGYWEFIHILRHKGYIKDV